MLNFKSTATGCLIFSLFTITIFNSTHAATLTPNQKADVDHIIQLFQHPNPEAIAKNIEYPLQRQYPIPSVENSTEFTERFKQIFDQTLILNIAQSKPSQWTDMGWRGVMLDNGKVWLQNNKISAINYQSDVEKNIQKRLIQQQSNMLHSSLKKFEQPVMVFKTTKYLIRIDALKNGQYRYASWKIGKSQASKPDLVLNHGQIQFDGSGGNHHYQFKSGAYIYIVDRNVLSPDDTADVFLRVEKNHKSILNEDGRLISN